MKETQGRKEAKTFILTCILYIYPAKHSTLFVKNVMQIKLTYLLMAAFLWKYSEHVQLAGEPRADRELAGGTIQPVWPGNASDSVSSLPILSHVTNLYEMALL